MLGVFQNDGFTVREGIILVLFSILFGWIASSFWMVVFGAFARFTRIDLLPLKRPAETSAARTAILMPIYNEDVGRVFSGVRAIRESAGPDFDFYILSDSTNPASWVTEELEWQKLKRELGPDAHIYYRHRARNIARKAGNIQDFCENWGQLYDYMVILDADSLMTGKTLSQLVGLMDANPRVGLIQAPPQLVGRGQPAARQPGHATTAGMAQPVRQLAVPAAAADRPDRHLAGAAARARRRRASQGAAFGPARTAGPRRRGHGRRLSRRAGPARALHHRPAAVVAPPPGPPGPPLHARKPVP